jgi:hypothetical protein
MNRYDSHESNEKLASLSDGINAAMHTAVDASGTPRRRPVSNQGLADAVRLAKI